MKKIVFLGACEPSDVVLVLGKLLAAADQRVLIVDATMAWYLTAYFPLEQSVPFIVEWEGFDLACGFLTFAQLDRHVRQMEGGWPVYDVLVIVTDHTEFVKGSEISSFDGRVLVSTLEKPCLQKNVDLLNQLLHPVSTGTSSEWIKMIVPFVEASIGEPYLDSLFGNFPIHWMEPSLYIPFDEKDYSIKIDNQHHGRMDVRRLSRPYLAAVQSLANRLSGFDDRTLKLAWKRARRRR